MERLLSVQNEELAVILRHSDEISSFETKALDGRNETLVVRRRGALSVTPTSGGKPGGKFEFRDERIRLLPEETERPERHLRRILTEFAECLAPTRAEVADGATPAILRELFRRFSAITPNPRTGTFLSPPEPVLHLGTPFGAAFVSSRSHDGEIRRRWNAFGAFAEERLRPRGWKLEADSYDGTLGGEPIAISARPSDHEEPLSAHERIIVETLLSEAIDKTKRETK